ncbi:hypothetical protein ACP4OV_015006 [Aristida adscensionis]
MRPDQKAVAFSLFLLVCGTTILPDPVIGTPCTEAQKIQILEHCKQYLKPGPPLILVPYVGACCDAVRAVPDRDMNCIVSLLTAAEKREHDEGKIKRLHDFCPLLSPPSAGHYQYVVPSWYERDCCRDEKAHAGDKEPGV